MWDKNPTPNNCHLNMMALAIKIHLEKEQNQGRQGDAERTAPPHSHGRRSRQNSRVPLPVQGVTSTEPPERICDEELLSGKEKGRPWSWGRLQSEAKLTNSKILPLLAEFFFFFVVVANTPALRALFLWSAYRREMDTASSLLLVKTLTSCCLQGKIILSLVLWPYSSFRLTSSRRTALLFFFFFCLTFPNISHFPPFQPRLVLLNQKGYDGGG